ncbi:hypothetical protein ACJROX_24400 [Pseudalkalibacillus sp. A8]|uniref:hypothetical protein n=1 Tax=Pseudalkalibacillus sp. A8 TaxID=3382641 RepID=UPI0038B5F582
MTKDWTYEELLETIKSNRQVECAFSKAVQIINTSVDPSIQELTFRLGDGWKARPEAFHIAELMKEQMGSGPFMFRLLRRLKHTNSSTLKELLAKELGILTCLPVNISRVHGRKIKHGGYYEMILSTIRFENNSIAQIEVAIGEDLTEVYEVEAADKEGVVFYRNERLSTFEFESKKKPVYDAFDEFPKSYSYLELKKALDTVKSVDASILTHQTEVIG